MSKTGSRYFWFKASVVLGGLLGLALLVQSIVNYHYISRRLLVEQLKRDANRQVANIERTARQAGLRTPEGMRALLEEVLEENAQRLAWLRIVDVNGKESIRAGEPAGEPFTAERYRSLFDAREPPSELRTAPKGEVLVVAMPIRLLFRPPAGGLPPPPGVIDPTQPQTNAPPSPAPPSPPGGPPGGGPPLRMLELGLYLDGAASNFGVLRRNTILNVAASLALLGAMAAMALNFRRYVTGKQAEQQMELARTVQLELLSSHEAVAPGVSVAAECVPAWQVGGDFYDVLNGPTGRLGIVLGDVSGKGLPAALLMGVVHGAVRSSGWMEGRASLEEASGRLNQLLCQRTSGERFASLFWGLYDAESGTLAYVNAGHPPGLLFHGEGAEGPQVTELAEGGPVLGLLPGAAFRQGAAQVRPGDLLVLYSDGVTEAANAKGEEYGVERLVEMLKRWWNLPPAEIRERLLKEVRAFADSAELADDLTLVLARVDA